jgi:PAS domain S-box-containing protein
MIFIFAGGRVVYANQRCEEVTGYTREEFYSPAFDFRALVAPGSTGTVEAAFAAHMRGEDVEPYEYTLVTKDGRQIEAINTSRLIPFEGRSAILGIVTDITERKRAEEALRKAHAELERRVEERTAELARAVDELRVKDSAIASSLNGIGITDMTGTLVYANDALVTMWGYESAGEVLGRPIAEFWRGDSVLKTLARLRTTGSAAGEDMGRKKDGTPFPVEFTATMIRDDRGEPSYLFGSFVDITERKRAEEALRASERALTVSRDQFRRLAARLLTAQEEERRRLARELHDDLSQRMAVLTIDAGKLEMQIAAGEGPDAGTVRAMRERLARLSEDIRDLSRELHPSILEHLGLVDALRTECTTVAQREGIRIDYQADEVPEGLSRDAALCLYRIAQEALRNVVRHARTEEAHVSLASNEHAVVLTVEDKGAGFDPAETGGTVGLASMAERARLVHGELTITSRSGHGTTVRATVPLRKDTP